MLLTNLTEVIIDTTKHKLQPVLVNVHGPIITGSSTVCTWKSFKQSSKVMLWCVIKENVTACHIVMQIKYNTTDTPENNKSIEI